MKSIRQFAPGILVMLMLIMLVIGAFVISIAETGSQLIFPGPTKSPFPTLTQFHEPTQFTPTHSDVVIVTITPTSIALLTPTNSVVSFCNKPDGWITIFVKEGDTISSLAEEFKISLEKLVEANCIIIENQPLLAESLIYVPQPVLAATATGVFVRETPVSTQCGHPPGWITYTVQKNDNLYRLGLAFGVSVEQLRYANCLGSDVIIAGEKIYVPNVPTRTAVYTPIPTSTSSPIPSKTLSVTLAPPTPTLTATPSITPSQLPTTLPPTATSTILPSSTPIQTTTPTNTQTPPSSPTITSSPVPSSATTSPANAVVLPAQAFPTP